jgi:hypothetical protein
VSNLHLRRHALNARAKLIDGNGNADGAQLPRLRQHLNTACANHRGM